MTTTAGEPPGADVRDNVRGAYEVLRDGFRALPYPDARTRKGWLRRLVELVRDRRDAIVGAIDADFGHRSRHESLSADVYVTVAHTRYLLRHVDRWMEPEARPLPLALLPGQARVLPQPKGVVGVLAPWNYPVQLSLLPLATALAAGNRVLLKPSEHTPRTTELLCEMLAEAFPADVVGVVVGGPSVGVAVSELPLDHLFFTGSEHVGRKVLAAAAKHLVPVTLELGGKAPAFVLPGAPGSTARAIAAGKLFNAGQTCLAPDYALVVGGAPAADALVDQIRAEVARMLPTLADNPDYTSLIHDDAAARHQALLDDAAAKGQE